jgi:hypothetical protein
MRLSIKTLKQYIHDECIIVAYTGPSAKNLYIVNKKQFENSSDDNQVTISLISPLVDVLDRMGMG